jgi:hypothetical protein
VEPLRLIPVDEWLLQHGTPGEGQEAIGYVQGEPTAFAVGKAVDMAYTRHYYGDHYGPDSR